MPLDNKTRYLRERTERLRQQQQWYIRNKATIIQKQRERRALKKSLKVPKPVTKKESKSNSITDRVTEISKATGCSYFTATIKVAKDEGLEVAYVFKKLSDHVKEIIKWEITSDKYIK
jgi:hypothetical protein